MLVWQTTGIRLSWHQRGNQRHEHKEWAEIIKSQVYPHHSDADWEDYVEWVEKGGGDEWFQTDINEQSQFTAHLR